MLSPFVVRVVIANPLQVKAIAHARVKTDKVDAGALANLYAAGVTLSATAGPLTLSVPPGAVARVVALVSHASAVRYVLFSCPDDPDLAASASVHNARCLTKGGAQTTVLEVPADASSRIRHRADAASTTLAELMTLGWIDTRGRDQ